MYLTILFNAEAPMRGSDLSVIVKEPLASLTPLGNQKNYNVNRFLKRCSSMFCCIFTVNRVILPNSSDMSCSLQSSNLKGDPSSSV